MHPHNGFAILAFLTSLSCSSRPPSDPASIAQPVPDLVQKDSIPPCTFRTNEHKLSIRCSYRDDVSDWNRVALVVDRLLMCAMRTRSDTVPVIDPERLRAIRPESIVSIETFNVVPDTIQRGCDERLRRVIYIVTK